MATSKVIFSYPSGETLVVRALPLTGNAYLLTSTSVSEAPANSGLYTATFTEASALNGAYRIVITLSGTGVASYQARWTGSDGETVAATELIDVSQLASSASIAALNNFDPASDAVANVTLCATTTTNSDMRGTDSAALASALSTIDGIVDSILVDTGTTIPAQITSLNDFNPATDAVANVTLVATTTTNTDMRGTDGANTTTPNTVAPDNASVAAILVDTGTTIPAQITGLNNFDPASDAVANVTLVATTTTNSDMRGTDGANTTAPDNSSITAIKSKTDQLVFTVANQVDSNALSGGGSGLDAAGVRSAVGLSSANLDTQLSDIPTVAEFESRTIAAASYFNPATDTVANVTLVGTTTTNTDMRGTEGANTTTPNTVAPDNASIASILVDTNDLQTNQGDWVTATGFSTFNPASDTVANVTLCATTTTNTDMRGTDGANTVTPVDVSSNVTAIKAKTDQFVFSTANQVDAKIISGGGGGGGDTAAEIYTYFTDGTREDAFKADSTLAKQNEILAKLSTTTQVFTDPDMANPRKITIIRGDAYDSVSWPAKSWDVGRDINGLTFRFTIKDQIDGNVIFQSTGTGVSQVAAPVITSAQSILLQKTEVGDEYYWDLEIQYSATSFGTPLYGTVEVVDDVTTPGDRS
jgi:hypothetical protein